MPNIFKFFSSSSAERYAFPEVADEPEPVKEPEERPVDENEEPAAPEEPSGARATLDYAQVQAEAIVNDARREADDLLYRAREEAEQEAQRIYQEAKEAGRQDGYAEGMQQAQREAAQICSKEAERLAGEVQQFLDRASAALDEQMDKNLEDLKDLAIAVAEKVISVSLRSSNDIIARLVQSALDKRKHREWIYIYIAESDVRRMGQIPDSLTAALSGLSDRVRIIPMADDEPGTCVIETPEEIIDASVPTQLGNIRNMLSNVHQTAADTITVNF